MHSLSSQTTFILISTLILIGAAELSIDQIRRLCPSDKPFCVHKAAQGECYGKTLKADTLKRTCQCSCSAVHHDRIQSCCKTVGEQEMMFCLPLCGYNTTVDELSSGLGVKCVSQLTTWAYCAADASDNVECCQKRGVSPECLSFCKGDVPTCDLQNIFSYQPCLKHIKSIIQCHVDHLGAKPRYDPQWTARCEWDESD